MSIMKDRMERHGEAHLCVWFFRRWTDLMILCTFAVIADFYFLPETRNERLLLQMCSLSAITLLLWRIYSRSIAASSPRATDSGTSHPLCGESE